MKTIFELGPDYKGRIFGPPFFVAQWPGIAPGWFVFGRNEEYGCRLIKMVARPDVPPRQYKKWNGKLSRGWWKKCDAQEIADRLNDMDDKLVLGGK
jgi:hypothetical protein